MTRGTETGALLPRIDTIIKVPGHLLTGSTLSPAPALVLSLGPGIIDIPARGLIQGITIASTLLFPDRVQEVLDAGWLSPIGLGALTTKAVRAAKEKAFSKPGGFQLNKETRLIIQSVRMVDNSGDKDLS
ncbi:hypothetical protein C8J56DRAFT_1040028 [Mycena floridula]|nr:hypothetical protein C8J56DRAFT_1040028 [Mycena floridula]